MRKSLLFFSLLFMAAASAQGIPAAKLSGVSVSGTGNQVPTVNTVLHRATNSASLLQAKMSEYTRIPLGQSPQAVYSAAVNNDTPGPVFAQVRIRIFDPSMNEMETVDSEAEILAPNTTSSELQLMPEFNPTVAGTYTFTYEKVLNGTPDTSDSVSYTVEYTTSQMARDDGSAVGQLGIGAGNGGYLGQTYTYSEAATLASVDIFQVGNAIGTGESVEMGCAVFKMVAGVPQLLYTAPSQQIPDGATGGWLNYAVNPPLDINAGDTILVCAQEFALTIGVGLTTTIFTEDATYVNWPTSPFGTWAHNEDFNAGFAKPYMIRPNLACTLPDPAVAATQQFCTGATVADLSATGTNIEWFEDAVGGTALTSDTVLTTDMYYVSQFDGFCYSERVAVAVTVTAYTTNTTVIEACDSYMWAENGTTYTASGIYDVVNGCHTETLDLTVTTSTITVTTVDVCDSYTWAVTGGTYTTSNIFNVEFGCHTERLEMTITPSTSNTTVIDACDSYTWAENGVTYTDSGVYDVVTGCHTETLDLTITPSTSNTTVIDACDSYTWAENGVTYTDSGVYDIVTGCHTETLDLTITPSTSNTTVIDACDSYTWAENGVTYTDSGVYDVVTGCHTETLDLTITPSTSNTTVIDACDSYTWAEDGFTYTETGIYDITDGCHTETLDLTITPGPYFTVQPVSTEVVEGSMVFFSVVAQNVGTYQWQGSADNGQSWIDIPEGSGFTGTNTGTLEINGALITMEANGVLFRAVITNGNCNAISNEATLLVFLGINPIDSDSIVLYPNPTHRTVRVSTTAATAVVTVFDINGRLIRTQQLVNGEGNIDLSDVHTGVYLFTVATENGIIHKKVVKQ